MLIAWMTFIDLTSTNDTSHEALAEERTVLEADATTLKTESERIDTASTWMMSLTTINRVNLRFKELSMVVDPTADTIHIETTLLITTATTAAEEDHHTSVMILIITAADRTTSLKKNGFLNRTRRRKISKSSLKRRKSSKPPAKR